MDCSPPGFSVHGILQARILEWVAIPFSRGVFPTRDLVSLIARTYFYHLRHHLVWLPQNTSRSAPPLMPMGGRCLRATTHTLGQGHCGFLADLPLLWGDKLE